MARPTKKDSDKRKPKHFTLSPGSVKIIAKLKKHHEDNESRVIDAALKLLAEATQ